MRFTELPLSEEVLAGVEKAGYSECTDVQERVLPLTLSGRDVMVQSKTGSGKTAVFLLTILEKYAKNKDVVVCASDLMAIGAMNALIDMDIFRPVCGFDGITLMGYVGKQMNTVKQDFYSISSRAVEEVKRLMDGEAGRQVVMPHSIVKMYYKDIIR